MNQWEPKYNWWVDLIDVGNELNDNESFQTCISGITSKANQPVNAINIVIFNELRLHEFEIHLRTSDDEE